MKKVFDFIYNVRLERFVATWFSLLVVAIMFMNVVLRFGFHFAFNWGDEIVRYLNLYAAFFAISAAFKYGGHIAINVVVENIIPHKLRKYFRLFAEIICLVFCLFVAFYGIQLVGMLAGTGQTSPALHLPMYLLYMVIPIGMILSSIQILIRIFYEKSSLFFLEIIAGGSKALNCSPSYI